MNNIDIQYIDLLKDILDNGTVKKVRNGETIGVFGRVIRHDMKLGFPLLTTKKMAWKQIVTELLWFLRGESNIQSLVKDGNHIWVGDAYKYYERSLKESGKDVILDKPSFIQKIKMENRFAAEWGDMGPIYGVQWRDWESSHPITIDGGKGAPGKNEIWTGEFERVRIDQIQNLLDTLQKNPDDRRMIVSAWHVDQIPSMKLPPCHYSFQVYTRELSEAERIGLIQHTGMDALIPEARDEFMKKYNVPTRAISLMWNQRSVDTPLGLPFNIASYGLLLQILGLYVNMVPDELIAVLGDTHIYTNQIEGVKEQIKREPKKLPTLDIHPGILDYDIDKLEYGMFTLENYDPHPKIYFPLSN